MGRKPVTKSRIDDPKLKNEWIKQLTPLYLKNGLTRFTMDDIAAKLCISKATLYKYFASREEILDDVVHYTIKRIIALESALKDDTLDYTQKYFDIIRQATMMLAEISPQFLSDTRVNYPDLWKQMHDFQDLSLKLAEQFYQKGIEAGEINPINPKILALTDKIFIAAISSQRFLDGTEMPIDEVVEGYFKMKSHGIFKK